MHKRGDKKENSNDGGGGGVGWREMKRSRKLADTGGAEGLE